MINNTINYFEYLGLRPDATIEEIKRAIQDKEAMFIRDGIDKQSISKTMVNEELRNIEREKYLEILRQNQESEDLKTQLIDYDKSLDDLDNDDIKEVKCWNCGTTYETGLFYNENCPNCNVEVSARQFNEEISRIERQILENGTKEQLNFAVDIVTKKYASDPNYKANEILNSIRERINNLETLDNIHGLINVALENIEKNYNKRKIFSAYKEYEKNKEILISEGINYDSRITNVISKYKECEQCLQIIKEAAKNKDYNILFANIKKLKSNVIDCYEIDEIMKENPIPPVSNLSVIEKDHKVFISWDYSINGVYFSIHKEINNVESNIIEEIYEKEFEYEETTNGAEVIYTVSAHFENINSKNNPIYKIRFYDNVKNLAEEKVSGAITYSWLAPDAAEILVIKKENEVPTNWQDGTLVTEVNRNGFIDKDVVKGKKYGYKIKCVYNFDGAKFESKEINIHPVLPYYDFLPISIMKHEIDYDTNIWKVQYFPLELGVPILLVNEQNVDIDEEKIYSVDEINEMNFKGYGFNAKGNQLFVPLEFARLYNFYIGAIYENQVYLKAPIEVISKGYIYNIKVNNIGGLNKTLEVSFNWGLKSKQIILVDSEDDYLEDYKNVMDAVYKSKSEDCDEDSIIIHLKDRKNHFISIFEVDELGKSRLIKKLCPLTKNSIDLYYEFKFKKDKIITTLYLNCNLKIDDIFLCKVSSNGSLEKLYGPVELITKYVLFKGTCASFTYESKNINIDSNYILRFNGNSNNKVFNINGKVCMLVLKEKNNE